MTLYSWFVKEKTPTSSNQMNKQGVIATSSTVELNDGLVDELTTFNKNTMWPIAKVKTTTMIIKKPQIKVSITKALTKTTNTNLVTIPLSY